MRASRSSGWVFLSNPRSGSKSIRQLLNPHADVRVNRPGGALHPHAPARAAAQAAEAVFGRPWGQLYSFTTIRNPWARMASFWAFGQINPGSVWARRREAAGGDFTRFCLDFDGNANLSGFCHDRDGRRMVTDIVPIEQAAERLPALLRDLGLPIGPMPHVNASGLGDWRPLYTEAAYEAVARYFASDIAFAGYSFDAVSRAA